MVNQIIYEYLKQYKDKYPLEALRKKILSRGYAEKDFNEALKEAEKTPRDKPMIMQRPFANNQPTTKKTLQESNPNRMIERTGEKIPHMGVRWIKTGGIIGIILLILTIGTPITAFTGGTIINLLTRGIIPLILGPLLLLLIIIYYFAFIKLGKHTEEKTLTLGALLHIIGILGIIAYLTLGAITTGIEALTNISMIWLIILGILGLGILTGRTLFIIGLIKSAEKVKYCMIAGILAALGTIVLLGTLGYLIYIVMSGGELTALITGGIIILINGLIIGGATILGTLFETLALFNGSKNYEN